MMEWSTTRSTGTSGSMDLGFLPSLAAVLRMAARSASSGTPVKSCSTTRDTTKGLSSTRWAWGFPFASGSTCARVTLLPSQLRSTDSSTMRSDTGNRRTCGYCLASSGREKNLPFLPPAAAKDLRVFSYSWRIVRLLDETLGRHMRAAFSGLLGMHQDSDFHCAQKRSEEHTSELQSQSNLVCRLLL